MIRPLGSKTTILTSLFILSLGVVGASTSLKPEHLKNLTNQACFYISFFAILSTTGFFFLFDLRKPSGSYFRFGRLSGIVGSELALIAFARWAPIVGNQTNNISVFDFSKTPLRLLCVWICLVTSALCFNQTNTALVLKTPQKIAHAGARFCPPEEWSLSPSQANAQASENKKKSEPRPGCELIERAHALGLVKDLGTCQEEESTSTETLCTLRQRDEPSLHYSFRLLSQFMGEKIKLWRQPKYWSNQQALFKQQFMHFRSLFESLGHVLKSSPRSSHHIFTDLPKADSSFQKIWQDWFSKQDCLARYNHLPHTIHVDPKDPTARSRVFEHIYGQMLFNPKYDDVVGLCKEYVIHWNSPKDSCLRLAKAPEAFLKSMGIENEIQTVLARLEEQRDISRLHFQLSSIENGAPPPLPRPPGALSVSHLKPKAYVSPESIISFQCIVKADVKTSQAPVNNFAFRFLGHDFQAREIKLPPTLDENRPVQVDTYKYFAEVMAGSFHYTSEENHRELGITSQWHIDPIFFQNSQDYPLSRLESLKETDIFFGNDWLQNREDLLEIYPYYHHLYHFISLFRQEYQSLRTRL